MTQTEPSREGLRHWSTVAPAWEAHRTRVFEQVRPVSERLVDRLEPRPGQTVLELTAGPGETGFLVAERLGPDGRLISSDFVPEMVQAAERGVAARALTNVECRVLDAEHIDLPDDCVDGVLSRLGIMLVPAQEQALAEVRRVLRPGGRVAYATWGPPDRNPWIFQLVMALRANGVALPGDPFAPGGVFSLSAPERNRELVAGAGFTDVTVEEVVGAMHFDGPDDHWSFNTALAGPVADAVATLGDDRIREIRATLDPSLRSFEVDGGLELPWQALVTSATCTAPPGAPGPSAVA